MRGTRGCLAQLGSGQGGAAVACRPLASVICAQSLHGELMWEPSALCKATLVPPSELSVSNDNRIGLEALGRNA